MSEIDKAEAATLTSGSIVENSYVRRSVRVLAIHEHEVESISFLNGLASGLFSLTSAFVSFAVATWVNVAFQTVLSPEATILAKFVSPAAVILGGVAAYAGWVALRKRGSTLTTIKAQSISQ